MNQVVAFAIGALIVALGMSFGGMHGYAMNPARDFSPRLFVWLAGFKNTGFDASYVWLDAVIGPIVGGVFGGLLYNLTLKPTITSPDEIQQS